MTDQTPPIEALSYLGFSEAGAWQLVGENLHADISNHASARDLLYAFVTDSEVLYIGKSTNTLAQRMSQYEQPGPTQATNIRNNRDITRLLVDGEDVRILVFVEPEPMQFRGYRINLAAGLEDELIRRLHPKWNKVGKRKVFDPVDPMATAPQPYDHHPSEPTSLVWARIQDRLKAGSAIKTWSNHSGYLEGSFTVSDVSHDSVKINSPGANTIQIVPREDFERVSAVWSDYAAGDLPRHKLRDMTRFSTYIISILHHVTN